MCISLFLCLVGVNRPWRDRWMTGWMWSIISSICPVIAGLWHVCHLFLLLSPLCRVYIPLFLRLIRVNRPWQDGWMIEWMDDERDEWTDASQRRLLYVMFFHTLFRVHTPTYIYIYLFTSVFSSSSSSFLFFPILSIFSIFWSFFPRIHTIKKKFPISSKKICSHSVKIHQEKSLLCTEFLLFFHSRFICYDRRPRNFSFSPQAAPIIATGQGEPPAPTLVHSPSSARPLRGCLCRFRDPDFV
jgi:hypothetical protein